MKDRIKSAFDNIHAEEKLKETTLKRIYESEKKKGFFAAFRGFKVKRAAVVLACFVPLFAVGLLSFNVYNTESAYIDVDINPSVELSINSFGRVISANAYNEDGENLLADLDIKNEKIGTALPKIIDKTAKEGVLSREGLVSVTVQTDSDKESKLLGQIQSIIDETLSSYDDTDAEIFAVDEEVKVTSHDMHLTPAKYLAIQDLQEVDPTATVEGCRHNSISTIRKEADRHRERHRDGSGDSHNSGGNGSNGAGNSDGNSGNDSNQNNGSGSGESGSGQDSGSGNSMGGSGNNGVGNSGGGSGSGNNNYGGGNGHGHE